MGWLARTQVWRKLTDPCSKLWKYWQSTIGSGVYGEGEHESFQPRFRKPGHHFPRTEIASRQRPTGLEWGVSKSAEPGTQLEALIQTLGWSLKGHKDQIN